MIWTIYWVTGLVSYVGLAIYSTKSKVVPNVFRLNGIMYLWGLGFVVLAWPLLVPITISEIREELSEQKKRKEDPT